MKRTKIYISKSKVGNPDDLMQVRRHLSKLDVDILEFTGGEYSPKLLKSADILIVVPPKLDSGIVGKGQYTEVETFDLKPRGGKDVPIYLVYNADSKDILIADIQDYNETLEADWKSNYGDLAINSHQTINLEQFASLYGLEIKSKSYTGRKPLLGASTLL